MKGRLFTLSTCFVSIALLALLVPDGAWFTMELSAFGAPVLSELEGSAAGPDFTQVTTVLQSTPMMFIENVGQFADGARFQIHGGDRTIWLTEDGLWMTVLKQPDLETRRHRDAEIFSVPPLSRFPLPYNGVNIKLSFPGANPCSRLEPFNRLDTRVSYFVGNDPAKWRADVPVWGGVRYKDLYPGIDLEIISENGQIVQRVVARGNTNPRVVRLRVEGADALTLDEDRLRLATAIGEFSLPLLMVQGAMPNSQPVIFDVAHRTAEVASPFVAPISNPSSQSGASDLVYSTCLGGSQSNYGSSWERGYGIAVDTTGAAYVVGETNSWDFPTTVGAFDMTLSGTSDAFVVKLNATGSALVYATFLGGSYDEDGFGIAVDGNGSAYITGWTNSPNFPTTSNGSDTSYGGNWDAFVVKLNATGSALVYGTFLGGSHTEAGKTIVVDGNGAAHVAGWTGSPNFPTTLDAFDRTCGTDGNCNYDGTFRYNDVFVVKLNSSGSALAYSTFLGGSSWDDGNVAIAVDGSRMAYVTGRTRSSDFPVTPGAFDTTYNGGLYDVFLVKLNPLGSALSYATFLGGNSRDEGYGIAVDKRGAVYITGSTFSSDFPVTLGAFDTSYNGGEDGFVVKLDPTGSALAYSIFLGGSTALYSGDDYGNSIAVDGNGMAYVTGWTNSFDFPTTSGAYDTSFNGGYQLLCAPPTHICPDTFVVRLNVTGSALAYATFLGALPDEWGKSVAVDSDGVAYVVGTTDSSHFPTTPGAFDISCSDGGPDAFVVKLMMKGESVYRIYLPFILRSYP